MRLAMGIAVAIHAADGTSLYQQPERARRQLAFWKARGIDGVVLYDQIPDFYRTAPERFGPLKRVLDDVGLEVAAFNCLRKSLFVPELLDVDQQRCEHILDVCRVIRPAIVDMSVNVPIPHGLDAMQMAARPVFRGDFASDEAYRVSAAYLKPFARSCEEFGAQFSIELHDDGLQDTADGCLKLMRLIDEPNVGLNPDIGNWYRVPYQQRETWRTQMEKMASRTNYWEVKNYKRMVVPDHQRAYSWISDLDDGDMDFREAAVMLWRAGFRGWVCNEGGNGDRARATMKYIDYMRWILDEWIPLVTDEA